MTYTESITWTPVSAGLPDADLFGGVQLTLHARIFTPSTTNRRTL